MAATDPTITRGATAFLTSASTTLTFYDTLEEGSKKSGNLISLPFPGSDSGSTVAFDLMGVTREITLRGNFTVTSGLLTIANFSKDLNSLVKGVQGNTGAGQVGYNYVCQTTGETIIVYVNDANWKFNAGEPNNLEYNISLLEVSSTLSG